MVFQRMFCKVQCRARYFTPFSWIFKLRQLGPSIRLGSSDSFINTLLYADDEYDQVSFHQLQQNQIGSNGASLKVTFCLPAIIIPSFLESSPNPCRLRLHYATGACCQTAIIQLLASR